MALSLHKLATAYTDEQNGLQVKIHSMQETPPASSRVVCEVNPCC